MDKKKFGLFIKESRIKKELTQKDLAELLFIDVTAISKWERGISYPDITLIPDICKILDVNEHELIESSTDTNYRKMLKDAKKYNKQKDTIFFISSILYALAVLVCFIVNLAVDHTLNWFFVVLTSCICGYTFIPTILRFFQKHKFLVFLGSTLLGMFILFLTCSIYTSSYWFLIATISTILGYFMIFFPVLFNKQKIYINEEKYKNISRFFLVVYSLIIYVLTILLLVSINSFKEYDLTKALTITSYSFIILIAIGIVEIFKINRNFKISLDCIIMAVYLIGLFYVLTSILNDKQDLKINFNNWNYYSNGNSAFIIVSILIVVSITNFILGIRKKAK